MSLSSVRSHGVGGGKELSVARLVAHTRKNVAQAPSDGAMWTASLLLSLLTACGTRQLSPEEPRSATFLLQHHAASEMAPLLEVLLEPGCRVRRRDSHPIFAEPPVEKPVVVQVHADTARNALLIRGTEYQVRAALDMAHRLDVPASQPRRSTR